MAPPYFDIESPGFAIKSAQVYAAREHSLVRAHQLRPRGAPLRRDEPPAQAPEAAPGLRGLARAQRGHAGPFADWWASWVLNQEGEEHHRLRRLMNPAFSRASSTALVPRFQALADELIDGSPSRAAASS